MEEAAEAVEAPPTPAPPHSRFTTTAACVDTWPCALVATAE